MQEGTAHGPTGSVAVIDVVNFEVVEEVADLLETMCSDGPLLLVLEDLHWADDSTLAALRGDGRSISRPSRCSWSGRRGRRHGHPSWTCCGRRVSDAGADLHRLEPLGADEVGALIRRELKARAGARLGSIIGRAGGNPLLLVELLGSLVAEGWLTWDADVVEATGDELPSTLRDLVRRRMHYLPPRTLDLLQLASVLGDAVSIQDLAVVSGSDATDVIARLAEAFRGKLLDERDRRVVFRHQLVQQAIYEDLPASVRQAMHRQAADVLARTGADLAKVASHLLVGAEPGDLAAVRSLRHAAAEALPSAPSVAVGLLQRVTELLPVGHHDSDAAGAGARGRPAASRSGGRGRGTRGRHPGPGPPARCRPLAAAHAHRCARPTEPWRRADRPSQRRPGDTVLGSGRPGHGADASELRADLRRRPCGR